MNNKLLRRSAWTSFFLGTVIIFYSIISTIGASDVLKQNLAVVFVFGMIVFVFSAITLFTTKYN
jgi:hypothetical protein